MKNADKPVNPIGDNDGFPRWINELTPQTESRVIGLTKREKFCLHAGVPATGDDELDAIIREGDRMEIATQMMAAIMSNPYSDGHNQPLCTASSEEMASWAVEAADALLAELEKGDG